MATQAETEPEVGVAKLVGGIVHDARELLVEQMTLFQVEVKNDVRRTMRALAPLLAGLGVILGGLVLLGIGAAHFLVWADPEIPLWLAATAVGCVFAIVGVVLFLVGKSMLDNVSPTPDTALKGMKENIQWKTKK